jgi:pimeloyl-ACP methyl ester carboxylesterase
MTESSMAAEASAAEYQPISRVVASEGLSLHYLDWGNESGSPLLLIHGVRDHAHAWDWTARALRQDWHVIAMDLRGHGDYAWKCDPLVNVFAPSDFSADGSAVWHEIACPTLLLHGARSWTPDPEAEGEAAQFREHRSIEFEGGGHWLQHDQFDVFMAAVREFL